MSDEEVLDELLDRVADPRRQSLLLCPTAELSHRRAALGYDQISRRRKRGPARTILAL